MNWTVILTGLILLYLLYRNGYLIMQSKRAVLFHSDFRGRKDRMGFSAVKCTGWVSRVLKVREDGIYRFDLDVSLSAGTVQFQVMNRQKLPLLTLNPDTTRGRVQLEKGQRYYIRMEATYTSGDFAASWVKE